MEGNNYLEEKVKEILLDTMIAEKELLIYGTVDGHTPKDPTARNGQAYLEGWDTWSELGCSLTFGRVCTQPGISVFHPSTAKKINSDWNP